MQFVMSILKSILIYRLYIKDKSNGGLSDARIAGLNAAVGQYVYFFDSDDYISENLVSDCVRAMEAAQCDMVAFNYKIVDEENHVLQTTNIKICPM